MEGSIRAIAWDHARLLGAPVPPAHDDPNDMLSLADFANATGPDARLHGRSYSALWARSFRPLVRQWRGEPERALAALAAEVIPHLNDQRDVASLTRVGRREAHLTCQSLPGEYLAGLAEGFTLLAGARPDVIATDSGVVIRFSIPASDRIVRIARYSSSLRIPLLITMFFATLCALVVASRGVPQTPVAAWVLLGALGAQAGANAVHDVLRTGTPHPFGPHRAPKSVSLAQAIVAYAAAGTALWVLSQSTPNVVAFALAGLVLGIGYARLRDSGWGPLVHGLGHGPIVVAGVYAALAQPLDMAAILLMATLAFLGAARIHLDDLADRPLDEASGRRTLAVRLPGPKQSLVFAALIVAGAGLVPALLFANSPILAWLSGALLIAAAALALQVHLTDDPRQLGQARLAALALFVGCSSTVIVGWMA